MALEDRDWYREEPSRAWRDRWHSTTGGGTSVRTRQGAWLAVAVSVVVTAVVWKFDVLDVVRPQSVAPQPRVVRLSDVAGLDVVVSAPKQWRLTDPRFGTVTVVVPVGNTPRQAFVHALAARGFQVVG